MTQPDVVKKIINVLLIDKYGHIITVLHQFDLYTTTPTQILGKINTHEMYMHITPQDGSSNKKNNLAFKTSQEKKGKCKIKEVIIESSSDDDSGDGMLVLMVRNTTKMLERLNKKGNKRNPIEEMNCYNWACLVTLIINFLMRRKTSTRKRIRTRKMIQVMMVTKNRRNTSHIRRMARRSDSTRRRMARLIFLWLAHRY
jgi:hypothetical protein